LSGTAGWGPRPPSAATAPFAGLFLFLAV